MPIVTVEDEFMRQRIAAGLLRQIGVTDGIAASPQEYVEFAVRWAEESRSKHQWASRREAIRRAAPRPEGNRLLVDAFAQSLRRAPGRE